MTIEKNDQGTTVELKLIGWLDTQSAPTLEEEVNALDSSVTSLILDCTGLEYISSAGLRQFVATYKKMNGNLTLRNVPEEILKIIKMTGLDSRIRIE